MTDIAIVGDLFMRAAMFVEGLDRAGLGGAKLRTMELPWPDEPMNHGYHGEGTDNELEDLREYMGNPDAIADFIGDARIFINHLAPVTRSMLAKCPGLQMVAVSRGGPVNIDMAAASDAGVKVVNAPGRNASAVAEFTIGAILAQTRLISTGHDSLRRGEWRGDLYRADRTGDELSAQTVGLIGYGHIGSRVTKLLRVFGCKILVCDPYVSLDDEDLAAGVRQVELDVLLQESDIISLHSRVSEETRKFINAKAFAQMMPHAYFINTARGPMVDYDDLLDALNLGRIRGAMLETFWQEPVPADAELLRHPNVTLTPHIAGASLTTVRKAADMIAEEIRRHDAGEPPLHPC